MTEPAPFPESVAKKAAMGAAFVALWFGASWALSSLELREERAEQRGFHESFAVVLSSGETDDAVEQDVVATLDWLEENGTCSAKKKNELD